MFTVVIFICVNTDDIVIRTIIIVVIS